MAKDIVQPSAQTAEEIRRRPLVQYVITRRTEQLPVPGRSEQRFCVERSPAGTTPAHGLIDKPELLGVVESLEAARAIVPGGFRRMNRRRDDPPELVEAWV